MSVTALVPATTEKTAQSVSQFSSVRVVLISSFIAVPFRNFNYLT